MTYRLKFIELDLSKAKEHQHPDIDARHYFLAELEGYEGRPQFEFGKFTKEWYGWSFDCGSYYCGLQFDAPGYNNSNYRRLWKMVRVKVKEKKKKSR